MGRGSYTASDWQKLKDSRGISSSSTANDIFTSHINPEYLPRFFDARESRESAEHPYSTPIIIGLDDTGSMGYLSAKIASESLNELMLKLYSTNAVPDPQLMFAFYGDLGDSAPLQVTQFESDIRIAEQLTDLCFLNSGMGCVAANALWYFADKYTRTDKWEKHGEKGFIITIGDKALIRKALGKRDVDEIFGKKSILDISTKTIYKEAAKKYEIFHIVVDTICRDNYAGIPNDRVVFVDRNMHLSALPEIIISIIQRTLKKSDEEILAQWSPDKAKIVKQVVFDR